MLTAPEPVFDVIRYLAGKRVERLAARVQEAQAALRCTSRACACGGYTIRDRKADGECDCGCPWCDSPLAGVDSRREKLTQLRAQYDRAVALVTAADNAQEGRC